MLASKLQPYFLAAFIAGTALLAFFIMLPFLSVLALAAASAVAVYPLHRRVLALTGQNAGIAALLTVFVVAVFIVVPLVLIGVQVFREASQVYFSFTGTGESALFRAAQDAAARLREYVPSVPAPVDFGEYAKQALGWLVQNGSGVFSNVLGAVTDFFIFLIALYYFLKDGKKFRDTIVSWSPLDRADDDAVLGKLESAVSSVFKGSLVMALVQGVLIAIGFFAFGVPNALFWGGVAAVASFIPVIGTALVAILAAAFLFLTGHALPAVGLLAWGVAGIGFVDNLLRPHLIGRGTELHPLLVFLAVLGGLAYFGPSGLVLGPLALSLLFALFDISSHLAKSK